MERPKPKVKSFEIPQASRLRGVGEGPGQRRGAGRGRRQHRRVRRATRGTTSTSCGTGCPRGATSRVRCGRWRYRRIMGRGSGCSGCRIWPTGWPRPQQRCCWRKSWSRSSTPTATATVLGVLPMTLWPWPESAAGSRTGCWILTSGPSSTAFPMICCSKRSLTTPTSAGSCSTSNGGSKPPCRCRTGPLSPREKGTPQGSPISPLLANLFMHYAFDTWMDREHPGCPFERYADDIVAHCDTEDQAQDLRPASPSGSGPLA